MLFHYHSERACWIIVNMRGHAIKFQLSVIDIWACQCHLVDDTRPRRRLWSWQCSRCSWPSRKRLQGCPWHEARNGSASSMGRAMKGSTGLLERVDPVNGTVNNTGRKDIVFQVCLAVLLKGRGSSSGNDSGGKWCCTAAGLEVGHLMPGAHWWKHVCKDVCWASVTWLAGVVSRFSPWFDWIFPGKHLIQFFNFWWQRCRNLGILSHIGIVIFDAEQVYFKLQVTNINIQEVTTN